MMDRSKNLMYIMVRKIAEGTFKVIGFLLKRPDVIIRYSYSIDPQLFSIGLYK